MALLIPQSFLTTTKSLAILEFVPIKQQIFGDNKEYHEYQLHVYEQNHPLQPSNQILIETSKK